MLRKFLNMKNYYYFLLSVLFFTTAAKAQLGEFNLDVIKTDETCLGNGSLTFTVSNTTPGSSMLYKLYYLPDTSNPFAVLTDTYVGSLAAGTYKVEAIQTLGNQMNSQEETVTIENEIVPFSFDVSSSSQSCAGGGNIIVTATSGIASQYEIISGPETRPLQSSNTFENLPSGTYNIRAYNNCGVAKVKTFTLTVAPNALLISDPIFPETVTPVCDSITVNNIITATSGNIAYPVSVQHTLAPLSIGGDPIVMNQVFNNGSPASLEVSMVMPRYMTESYTYEISVTDNCDVTYTKDDNTVDPSLSLRLTTGNAPCAEKYLKLIASKYTDSYTVNFISVPEGFDPTAFNPLLPGPFTESEVSFGNQENTVPFGEYVVEITDICGRTATDTLLVEFIKPTPSVSGSNNGCFSEFGKIRINVPDQEIVTATLTAAPSTYGQSLPQDITSFINGDGRIAMNDMPLGVYTITFIDECGFEYEVDVEVPPYVEKPFTIVALPSCEPGLGTVRVKSGNGDLTEAYITAAPAAFGQSLPFNVSANIIAEGDLYMDSLPEGTYTFTATDVCGLVREQTIDVIGYNIPDDVVEFTPGCGSFSVVVNDTGNGTHNVGYWLQHYNEYTQAWEHPYYEIPYEEGTVPGTNTGIALSNGVVRNNLTYSGTFRIIKKFEAFGNATNQNTICISVLEEFEYTEEFAISSAYNLSCLGQPNDVMLEVTGYPVSYKIIEKNNTPFVVDNGTSNIFENLEPAEYLFQIEDACGNIDVQGINIQTLPSIADATQPADMVICIEPGSGSTTEFHLTEQDDDVLGALHSAIYTVTYHLTQKDADNGVNALPEYYTNISNGQTIYVRLVHNEIELCHGTTSFKLYVGEYQEPVITTVGTICNEGYVLLTANAGYDSYLWSNGATTRAIAVSEPGNYTVIVEKNYGTGVCDGYTEVEIKESVSPSIVKIDSSDWTRDENTITVHAEGSGDYEYSIDGVNYQAENVFTGLETGVYQVYVKDANGCGEDIKEVVLMNYPNFFTPNGDGVHDTWRIPYSIKEPHMEVTIFDRYGKVITTFGPNHPGWDGTLNGIQLPSTDYWFVVKREDGREFKGHFSMLR